MKQSINTIWPASVGFDRIFADIDKIVSRAQEAQSFPPHNIIKVSDNRYIVELAVAGFSKSEITVKIVDNVLEIRGEKSSDEPVREYLHKGIGTRDFVKTIKLAETVEVGGAEFSDGILRIGLENILPDQKKERIIEINSGKPSKEFLTES